LQQKEKLLRPKMMDLLTVKGARTTNTSLLIFSIFIENSTFFLPQELTAMNPTTMANQLHLAIFELVGIRKKWTCEKITKEAKIKVFTDTSSI
jgi:hypothetical protein